MHTFVKIIRNRGDMPLGKLADAELHFTGGELDGLRLIGFGIWERRIPNRAMEREGFSTFHLNVTLPARPYTVDGARRSFALLRSIGDDTRAQDRLREFVLQAFLADTPNTENTTPSSDMVSGERG